MSEEQKILNTPLNFFYSIIQKLNIYSTEVIVEDNKIFNIKFIDSTQRIKGERKSKLLSPKCTLYQYIEKCRLLLSSKYLLDNRSPHIELLRDFEKDDIISLNNRTIELENKDIPFELTKMGNALVIMTGKVEGYGDTHATVAFFKNGFDLDEVKNLLISCN